MQAAGPQLETERLILRPTAAVGFDGWAAFMGDAQAAHFIGGTHPAPYENMPVDIWGQTREKWFARRIRRGAP